MADLEHILRRAARRNLAQRSLHRAAAGLLAAAAIGGLLLLADRALELGVPAWFYAAVGAAGMLGGVVSAALARPPRLALAVLLDRTFDLKDRLSTAESIHRSVLRRQDAAFAALVSRDADRLAGTLDIAAATPVRITRIWGGATSAAALLFLGVLFLPSPGWGGRTSAADVARREEALQQQRAEIAQSIEEAVDGLTEDPSLDDQAREDLDALTELADQLAGEGDGTDPAAARDESASRLHELADRLAEQAEKDAAASEELARRFAGMDAPDAPMSAEEFAEALRRGEFGEAADLLDDLMRSSEALPEEERQALAEEIRQLGRQVNQAGDAADPAGEERRAQMEQALRDQGLDQQAIDDLLNADDPDASPPDDVQEQLEQRSVDEQIARELAREIEQQRRQSEIDEQARRDAQRVSDALDEAADAIENPATETPEQPQPDAPGEQGQDPQTPTEGPRSEPGGRQEPPPGQNERQQGPGQERQQGAQGERRQQAVERREQADGQGEQRPPDTQPPGQPGQPPPGRPQTEPQQQGAEPQTGAREAQGEQPSQPRQEPGPEPPDARQTQPMPGERGAQPQDEQGAAPEATEQSPGEIVRELERRRQAAEDRRRTAEQAREAARQMAENMTEEERRRWAEQWRRELGGGDGIGNQPASPPLRSDAPPRVEGEPDDLQLAGDEEASRLIAEWLGAERTGDPDATPAADGERIRLAQRAAERAVEDAVVPTRYHRSIKRYFDRLRETVDRASGEQPADRKPDTTSGDDGEP